VFEEGGKEMYLQEACIYGGVGLWRNKVGWQEAIDGLERLGESAKGVLADVPREQCKADREEGDRWHSQFQMSGHGGLWKDREMVQCDAHKQWQITACRTGPKLTKACYPLCKHRDGTRNAP